MGGGGDKGGVTGFIYGQCQRNFAAHQGLLVNDGCGEFIPSTHAVLSCEVCGCHRNFHSKIKTLVSDNFSNSSSNNNNNDTSNIIIVVGGNETATNDNGSTMDGDDVIDGKGEISNLVDDELVLLPLQVQAFPQEEHHERMVVNLKDWPSRSGVRKSRGRFTAEQVATMRAFAESLGWKMTNKEREPEVKRFCNATGLSRYTFRTWLNNNKKIYGSGSSSTAMPDAGSPGGELF